MTERIKVKSLIHDCDANWDEQDVEGDIYFRANNEKELNDLVKAMMFDSIEDFEELTEISRNDVIGKFFFLSSCLSWTNKIYILGQEDSIN